VHPAGFGGNADHWRKNTAVLAAAGMRVFAIDLLGYGYRRAALIPRVFCTRTLVLTRCVCFCGNQLEADA
jgi:pimeloyl-ACP methyl ester carboxylesterase